MLNKRDYLYYDLQAVSDTMNDCHVFDSQNNPCQYCEELLAQGMSVSPCGYKNEFDESVTLIRDDFLDKILDYCQNRNLANKINLMEPIQIKNH